MRRIHRSLVIRGGRLIDPASHIDRVADLVIVDYHIAAPDGAVPPDAEVIEASGQVVCPGFVDLHTHLRFPGFPEKETMATGTAAAAASGFTTVCAMANTQPVVDSVAVLQQVREEARQEALVRVQQLAAVSCGLRSEQLADLPALAAAGAVAFSDDGKPVSNVQIMRQALQASASLGKPISVHEEDQRLVGNGVANAGPEARRLQLPEWPCRGEASLVARDLALLQQVGGRLHVAHVSCAETVSLLRAARARGLPVTAEVTPHHLRLTDRLLGGDALLGLPPAHPCTKVNPPLRSEDDVAALVEALADGTIEAVATDHAPHSRTDKEGSYLTAAFGFSALETALPLLLELVRQGALDLPTLITRLTSGPAHAFGLTAGTLQPGAPADVCIFDPEARWTITAEEMKSKGKNTPLLGAKLRGRVTCAIVGGKVVYRRGV